jgi:hypothetical protein
MGLPGVISKSVSTEVIRHILTLGGKDEWVSEWAAFLKKKKVKLPAIVIFHLAII